MPDDVKGVFALDVSGVCPQNTGVSEVDMNIDRIIGEDARKGWTAIEEREGAKKATLMSNPGTTTHDLSMNPDGTYRVMPPEEKKIHARAFTINHMAMQRLAKRPKQT